MKKLTVDKFPDHIAQAFEYCAGQPFQYACLIGTGSNNYYQAFRVSPESIGQAKIWVDKLREIAKEIEEQIEHQKQTQKSP